MQNIIGIIISIAICGINNINSITQQLKQMENTCMLCYDDTNLFGITQCNHGPFCYRCVYKMRAINKNNSCPICKHKSNQIMISEEFNKFGTYKGEILPDSNFGDVFHCGKLAKKQFEKLKQYKCFVKQNGKPCKNQKSFENIAFLKKHLKQDHKRVLCDVCLEKKTCVLEQHKLYTQAQLNKHLERGDIDQIGNTIFMHPYCGFCKIYFFDQDEFKRHMGLEHMICNVCGSEHRYIYYKNYDSLETHYKISHYICSDMNCLAKKFIAFKSAEELKIHRSEIHSVGNRKIDGKQLCGFNYGGIVQEQIIEIKDKQGIDMHDQFLTLKKEKNTALGEADAQQDSIIDLRQFFGCSMDEDEHYHESFVLKHRSENKQKQEDQPKPAHKKKRYVQKQEFEKQKPVFAKQNQQFTIQQLNLVKTSHHKLNFQDFQSKLQVLLSNDDMKKLQSLRIKHNKRQINSEQFMKNYYEIMKKVSLKTGYEIFPHYLRTIQNQNIREQLELEYIKSLKKVPTKIKCILNNCKTYGDLFHALLKQMEINLQARIRDKTLSIKKPIIRQKQRLFQLIGIVRRLKINEMPKFKFASNFSIQLDTTEMIRQKIFKMNIENIQSRLSKIPNQQFIDIYVFVKYCYQALTHNQAIHYAKNKINQRVIEDFLFQRPQLQKLFGPKKEDFKTLDEKVQFEKEEEQKNQKKKLKDIQKKNKEMGYHAKTNFSLEDKGEFPDLFEGKKEQTKQVKQKYQDVIESTKNKPSTYQKKINELFPTLGDDNNNEGQKQKKQEKVGEKKEKAWWEELNKPKQIEIEENEVRIRKGKNKKQKWVSAKGFFGN